MKLGEVTHGDVLDGGRRVWCIFRVGPFIRLGVRDLATDVLSTTEGQADDEVLVEERAERVAR